VTANDCYCSEREAKLKNSKSEKLRKNLKNRRKCTHIKRDGGRLKGNRGGSMDLTTANQIHPD
jgi:hypothetical protein